VRLHSRFGEGTTVTLRVPLSMTVTRVMIVEVGENRFGLPMDDVVQTVRVAREAIRTVKHRRVFTLRERIVPLHRLRDLLALPSDGAMEGDSAAVMVVKLGAALVGLEVERFREGTDVIVKPLDGILAGMRGFTGTALLGDGQVLLILNPRELV
jgi:two-component system chemotaxis sensor kinase CheA